MTHLPHSQPNEYIKAKLVEAIEYGETMALHTSGDDQVLKDALFNLGRLYGLIKEPSLVTLSEIQDALDEFYAIDPDYIERIKQNKYAKPDTLKGDESLGPNGEVQITSRVDD